MIPRSLKKDFDKPQTNWLRVSEVKQDVFVSLKCDGQVVSRLKKKVVFTGEMESVILIPMFFEEITGNNITISIEEDVL